MNAIARTTTTDTLLKLPAIKDRGVIAQTLAAAVNKLSLQELVMQRLAGTGEKAISTLVQDGKIAEVGKVIQVSGKRFISMNSANDDESTSDILYDFTENILSQHGDLSLLDVLYFFRYIYQKQEGGTDDTFKIFHKLPAVQLVRWWKIYLEDRAEILERHHLELKQKIDQSKTVGLEEKEQMIVKITKRVDQGEFKKVNVVTYVRVERGADKDTIIEVKESKDATLLDYKEADSIYKFLIQNRIGIPALLSAARLHDIRTEEIAKKFSEVAVRFRQKAEDKRPKPEPLDNLEVSKALAIHDHFEKQRVQDNIRFDKEIKERAKNHNQTT